MSTPQANFSRNVRVRSGNRIVVSFGGIDIGLVQSVRMNDDYGPEPASGIGSIHPVEYVPTMARHTLSVSKMTLINDWMAEAGISAENGDDVLQGRVFDITAYGKDEGTILRKYMGCSYASGDIDVSKHAIVMTSAQFNALDVAGRGL